MSRPTGAAKIDATVVRYITEREPDRGGMGDVHLIAEREGGVTEPVVQVVYHSPTGVEYGYAGSGPADMALSILAHFFCCDPRVLSQKIRGVLRGPEATLTESERRAVHWHQDLKFRHVATVDRRVQLILYARELREFMNEQLERELGGE